MLSDDVIKEWANNHIDGLIVLIVTIVLLVGGVSLAYYGHDHWVSIPVVEREVFSNIVDDNYTECVFIINGERFVTSEYPCKYKEGEKVKTKLDGRIFIVD